MKSKKDYISMLNALGSSLSREEWMIGGKMSEMERQSGEKRGFNF